MSLPVALDFRPALLSRTGIARAVRELAAALAPQPDLDLHLFGHSLAHARVPMRRSSGATLHRWPIPGRWLPHLARWGWPAERLAGHARLFHWTDYVFPPVARAKVVLTVHDLAFVRDTRWHGADAQSLRARTKLAIDRADVLVAPSQATAQDLADFAPGKDLRVIPFGCDHVPSATPHAPATSPYAICIGTLEPRKNHSSLLQAWSLLPPPRPGLVLLGKVGWNCEALQEQLERIEPEGWLLWLPNCTDAQLFAWLAHARMLIYPSLWEGFGFPPLEAMQSGVPVLLHDCAPLRELAGPAAQFVDATDSEALAAAIHELWHDQAARRRLAMLGRARAGQFRWADCATAHAALYRELLA